VRVSAALPNSPCVLATPMLPILAIGPRGMQKMFARISDGGWFASPVECRRVG
jgi:hypothetical protein